MKSTLFICFILILNLNLFGQKRTCQSLHTGRFKAISQKNGTTIITRTNTTQVEENNDLGYKLAYSITWANDCTYELKLTQVLKGDPALINNNKYVIKVHIKQIKKNSYITENSSSFSDNTTEHEIIILH